MSSYVKYRDEALENDWELKSEYDALAPEYDTIQAMIDARQETSRLIKKPILSNLRLSTRSDSNV